MLSDLRLYKLSINVKHAYYIYVVKVYREVLDPIFNALDFMLQVKHIRFWLQPYLYEPSGYS